MSSATLQEMDTVLAISASLVVMFLGLGVFLAVLESLEHTFVIRYISAAAFLLIGAGASAVCLFGVLSGIWTLPVIIFAVAMVMLSSLLWSIGSEERWLYRYKKRKAPISAIDVQKGLDWKKLERWLQKQESSS